MINILKEIHFKLWDNQHQALIPAYVLHIACHCACVWMGVRTRRTFSHDLMRHFNIVNHWLNAKLQRWIPRPGSKRNTLTSRKPRSPICATIEGCKQAKKSRANQKDNRHRLLFMPHLSINTAWLHPTCTYKQPDTTFGKTPHGICEKSPKMWSENVKLKLKLYLLKKIFHITRS